VNHGNGDQRAEALKQNASPFDRADSRLADHDTLAASVQGFMKRTHHPGAILPSSVLIAVKFTRSNSHVGGREP
jgi:hypothetical protein